MQMVTYAQYNSILCLHSHLSPVQQHALIYSISDDVAYLHQLNTKYIADPFHIKILAVFHKLNKSWTNCIWWCIGLPKLQWITIGNCMCQFSILLNCLICIPSPLYIKAFQNLGCEHPDITRFYHQVTGNIANFVLVYHVNVQNYIYVDVQKHTQFSDSLQNPSSLDLLPPDIEASSLHISADKSTQHHATV